MMRFMEIKIITNNGNTSNQHEIGEVLINGPNVIDEYWAGTAEESKINDGWLATGDLGFFDNDGYLYLKGRKDDIINVGGEKVSPTEIELAIKQLDKIQDVGVIGVTDKTFGEIPVAFIVTKVNLETNEILAHCIKTLERYKIPQNFIFIDSVPKNESGKIERSALKEMYTKQ